MSDKPKPRRWIERFRVNVKYIGPYPIYEGEIDRCGGFEMWLRLELGIDPRERDPWDVEPRCLYNPASVCKLEVP